MQRFRNILVVFDRATGSRQAFDQAAGLAALNEARLSLMVCLTEFDPNDAVDEMQKIVVSGLRSHFDQLVEPLRADGLTVSVEIRIGRPFVEVIRHVIGHRHDLIVKVAEGSLHQGFPFGSTDLHLLRKCPCPVWMLKEPGTKPRGPVLAAVAPAGERADVHALNIKIFQLASSLAGSRGQELHVVQAWTGPDRLLMKYLGFFDPGERNLSEQLSERRHDAETRYKEMIASFSNTGVVLQAHFGDGVASEVIVRLAREQSIDTIVMGTLTRSGGPGVLIGQSAENILRQIDCSVLAVKPDGFVTPVAA